MTPPAPSANVDPAVSTVEVAGIPIADLDLEAALSLVAARARARISTTCVFVNAHTLTEAQRDPALRRALAGADLAFADGTPVHWLARALGGGAHGRVDGPTFLARALRHPHWVGLRHFVFGGTEAMHRDLARRFPDLRLAGALSPPFRPWTDEDADAFVRAIDRAGPDVVWVALGAPRQERWVAAMGPRLEAPVLLAVGAALPRAAGHLPVPPRWIQRAGLEWLHRLAAEPRRLAPRYLRTNPRFAVLALRTLASARRPRAGRSGP